MSSKLKAPPPFNPEEEAYEAWKSELEMWEVYSELELKKRGAAVYLSLKGKAKEAVRDMKAATLNVDNGLALVKARLDGVFLKDVNTRAFLAFQKFYEYRRASGDSYETFIVHFEQLYHKLHEIPGMRFPDGVQAFILLMAANLPTDLEKVVRATTGKITYNEMKNQIKKVCGTLDSGDAQEETLPVKDEVLFTNWRGRGGRGKGKFRGRGRGSSRNDRVSISDDNVSPNFSFTMKPCYLCNKTDHLVGKCPYRGAFAETLAVSDQNPSSSGNTSANSSKTFEVNIVLLSVKKSHTLMYESLGKGVLDSACTRTVAGATWMDEFLGTLSPSEKDMVKENFSEALFRFGDGVECKSLKQLTIPVNIGGMVKRMMKVEIVPTEVPLLISNKTMKRMGMKLDFANDTVYFKGKKLKLATTSTGHYCMPISAFSLEYANVVLQAVHLKDLSREEKSKKAQKLHTQFGHARSDQLLQITKDNNICDDEFKKCIVEVCTKCEFCQKYKPAPLKPAVGLPRANEFNQVVAMDLKDYKTNKIWILHVIDLATRFSAARLVTSKKAPEIARKVMEMWIAVFGRPRKFMADNGGEFSNNLMRDVGEQLGVELTNSPAESPFSNGVVERHHKVLYETMRKTIDETKCDPQMALAWACSAKNSLQNHHGFCPNQLVFGRNTNVPSVLTDDIPALDHPSHDEMMRRNLSAQLKTRENYIKSENSDRIRRALRTKTRNFANEEYTCGDKVFYKRMGTKYWKGPGIVMGLAGNTVLVKHNGAIYKCHKCHLMKKIPSKTEPVNTRNVKIKEATNINKDNIDLSYSDDDTDSSDDDQNLETSSEDEGEDNASVKSEPLSGIHVLFASDDENMLRLLHNDDEDDSNDEEMRRLLYDGEEEPAQPDEQDDLDDLYEQEERNIETGAETVEINDDSTLTETQIQDEFEDLNSDDNPENDIIPVNDTESKESYEDAIDESLMRYNSDAEDNHLVPETPAAACDLPAADVESNALSFNESTHDEHTVCQEGSSPRPLSSRVRDALAKASNDPKDYTIHHAGDRKPNMKSFISVKEFDQEWYDAEVIATQPKRSGTNKDWVNLHIFGKKEACSLNWTNVERWKYIPPPENVVLLSKTDEMRQEVVDAKHAELDKLKRFEIYEEVPFTDQEVISSRWVLTEKMDGQQKKYKARLVARGFEEDTHSAEIRTDSPTCSRYSLRLLFVAVAMHKWKIHSLDISSAFLQSDKIERELYLQPPKDTVSDNIIWKLKKPLYGLCDAPRAWYDKLKAVLLELGGVRSVIDHAMFMWYEAETLIGHLVAHVDDLTYGGTDNWLESVIKTVKFKLKISAESDSSFKYIGLNVVQCDGEIMVDQQTYVDGLEEIELPKERLQNKDAVLLKTEKSLLRSLSGSMLWVTALTRPDLAFETCMMSNPGKQPTIRKIVEANKAVRKIKANSAEVKLRFPPLGDPQKLEIVAFSDASHANLADSASQGAFIIFVQGNNKVAPLLWQSKKLKRVAKSPLASETLAFGEMADAAKLMATLVKEVFRLNELPPVHCFTDSKSLHDTALTSNTVEDKSLSVEIARIREMVTLKELFAHWCTKDDQLADVMTKRGASSERLIETLATSSI